MTPRTLPPPAGTILLYAADGLSTWSGRLGPTARPRAPSRLLWVPMFRELVDSDEGIETLHALAKAGMRAWRCPPGVIGCLEDALQDITFRALSIAALEQFADMSAEKVILPQRQPAIEPDRSTRDLRYRRSPQAHRTHRPQARYHTARPARLPGPPSVDTPKM